MTAAGRGFPRGDRLRRGSEFRVVARRGRRAAGPYFVVVAAPSAGRDGSRRSRLGVTVSRRVGKAVLRNRVKRRVREWFRASRGLVPEGLDLVVIARRGAGELRSAELAIQLDGLAVAATERRG